MRKVCAVTGTRAEYGLLYWLMRGLAQDARAQLQLIATGMHMAPEFGLTYRLIEADGFRIDAKVEMLLSSDSGVGMAKSIGLGTIGLADAFERLRPDIVVLLGDRFEALAAAQAAMAMRIPIAHFHGGEATEGLIDEAIRHAITKMAHLHFVAAEPYRRRVVQLGEQPNRVFNVGAMGIDNIVKQPVPDIAEIEKTIGFKLASPVFLVTYHPVTLDGEEPGTAFDRLLRALDAFPGARVVLTKANADAGGRIINQKIDDYAAQHPDRVHAAASLGQRNYLGVMAYAAAVIGNSSSGILEAPTAGVPTVNIGDRQRGRLRSLSVIDCRDDTPAIIEAIQRATTPEFQAIAARRQSAFGNGGAAAAALEVLLSVPLDGILLKSFNDAERPA